METADINVLAYVSQSMWFTEPQSVDLNESP